MCPWREKLQYQSGHKTGVQEKGVLKQLRCHERSALGLVAQGAGSWRGNRHSLCQRGQRKRQCWSLPRPREAPQAEEYPEEEALPGLWWQVLFLAANLLKLDQNRVPETKTNSSKSLIKKKKAKFFSSLRFNLLLRIRVWSPAFPWVLSLCSPLDL